MNYANILNLYLKKNKIILEMKIDCTLIVIDILLFPYLDLKIFYSKHKKWGFCPPYLWHWRTNT